MSHGDEGPERPPRFTATHRKIAAGVVLLELALAGVLVLSQWSASRAPDSAPAPVATRPSTVPLADFQSAAPSPDARLVANWVVATRDHQDQAFILVDKKDAQVYVFHPDGRLRGSAPALLGAARGDRIVPGSEDKTPAQMKPEEKTTPAGRFVAKPGVNADDEDVIWVDYDAAISMHRVRPRVRSEARLERLASGADEDNRISYGCINLPVAFYENVARPTVDSYGAFIYVLPEESTPQEVVGAYDVTDPAQVAAARQANVARATATVRQTA
ncbi:MAG TPA: hypothetical protein VGD76_08945 [Ramlibacter sp.]